MEDGDEKKAKQVYLLRETYKDNDPEVIGCFGSERSMFLKLARYVANTVVKDMERDHPSAKKGDIVQQVADDVATVIAAMCHKDWARGDEGEVYYGRSTYGYDVMDVENLESDNWADLDDEEDGDA